MQDTQIKRRKLRTVTAHRRERGNDERALAEQRKIAGMINSNPQAMINASNLFLCGWLAHAQHAQQVEHA